MSQPIIAYSIDPGDRIFGIEGPWDEFARANGAPSLTVRSLLGRRLFDSIAGAETQELVRLLLDQARNGRSVSIPFRCDAPTRRRFLRLAMRPEPGGSVRCESSVEREEDRPAQPLVGATAVPSFGVLVACSWCKKFRLRGGRWVEVEEAATALHLFEGSAVPTLSHGICESCMAAVREAALQAGLPPVAPDSGAV